MAQRCSHIEQTRPDLFPLRPLLGWAVRAVGPTAKGVSVDCDPWLHAYVDPDRVEQIVGILVEAVVEHGRPPFAVTAAPDRGDRVAVIVRDHSEAMEPTRCRLGLSIARDLARTVGGDLSYRLEDPGVAFVVVLPARAPGS
jgi:signal transduction histidine kinase